MSQSVSPTQISAPSAIDLRTLARIATPLLFAGGALGAFATVTLSMGGADLTSTAILGLIYGGTIVALSGFVLLPWGTDEGSGCTVILTILVGSIATSLFLMGGCLLVGGRAGTVFIWWSALVVVALACRSYWQRMALVMRTDRQEIVALVVILLVVVGFCLRSARLLPTLEAEGIAPVWSDYFIHGTEIAQFGDRLAVGHSTFLLTGESLVLYHYASFMIAAAALALVDFPGVGMAASLWLPYGVLLLALGTYALTRTMAGPSVGILAAVGLVLVPDASTYGLQNGFFGFHWLLFTAPGSSYALGVVFTALVFFARWQTSKRWAYLSLALLTTLGLFEFRAHVFLLFVPAVTATLLGETDFARSRRRLLLSAAVVSVTAMLLVVATVASVRDAWRQTSAFTPFIEAIHTQQTPTAYDGVFRLAEQDYGSVVAYTIGFVALIPIALGALAVACPLGLVVATRRTKGRPFDSFPIWCLVGWLGLVVVAPIPYHGDFSDFTHRPFVLVYASFFVWTLVFFDRALPRLRATSHASHVRGPMLVSTVVALGALIGWSTNPAKPRFTWGSQFFGVKLEQGFLEAAAFVRAHARPADTFVLIPVDPSARLDDAATRFAALANLPTYLARPQIHALRGPAFRALVEQRVSQLKTLEAAIDRDEAFALLRDINVTFLITLGEQGPRFDPNREHAVFQAGRVTVYRMAPRLTLGRD